MSGAIMKGLSRRSSRELIAGPPVVGVMGGAFNPVHLGHALLAVTVKETMPVDEVVLVPVFRHPVKTDLLPFEDRVAMCELAVRGKGVHVSTVEQETGESNVAMLRALRAHYPPGTRLQWVCGDDVFEWIDNPKGQAMMSELDGLIVQRRLHQGETAAPGGVGGDSFYKSPIDTARISALMERYNIKIELIFGELPHFSSTLVRSSPASWKAYLPQCVAAYLDDRPHLLEQLVRSSGGAPAPGPQKQLQPGAAGAEDVTGHSAKRRRTVAEVQLSAAALQEIVVSCVMRGLAVCHGIQKERGLTALALSLRSGQAAADLRSSRKELDGLLRNVPQVPEQAGEAHSMAQELEYAPTWLARDRALLDKYLAKVAEMPEGEDAAHGWLHREALLRKYNSRIDVLLEACAQVLGNQVAEMRQEAPQDADNQDTDRLWQCHIDPRDDEAETVAKSMLRLFRLWIRGKEALGRERAFVCAGGHNARELVRSSVRVRSRLAEVIEQKELMLKRIFSAKRAQRQTGPYAAVGVIEALNAMLARVTAWEWSLMRCFASSTPLRIQHAVLASEDACLQASDIHGWFETTSSAVDLMLTLTQGLAAAICACSASGQALVDGA